MGDEMQDGFEGLHGCPGAAGDVDDEGRAEGAGDGAAHGGERGVFETFAAHELAETVENAFANGSGGLGGDVARGDAGASGGDDELRLGGLFTQGAGDLLVFVWKDQNAGDGEAGVAEPSSQLRTGTVLPAAVKTGVAYGDDDGVHSGNFTFLKMAAGNRRGYPDCGRIVRQLEDVS